MLPGIQSKTYDNAGNITSRTEYAYTTADDPGTALDTVTYAYGDSNWGDLLTAYDGVSISHDAIGNPTNDGSRTFTWEHGRELATLTKDDVTWTYTYDANGMRTKRTNGSTTYTYAYVGSQLTELTVDGNRLLLAYDASGTPLAVTYNGTAYYYVTNLQGDVTALLNTSGTAVVTYTYDAWGNILTTSGSLASTLGVHNPLRYRGYVYDTETELYYLQSRYYDPQVGRFINADSYASTGQSLLGNNMFAYCGNNPIIHSDPSGNEYKLVGGGVQFELDCGNLTVGFEIIIYWDVDECEDSGPQIAVYYYGGISTTVYDPFIAAMIATILDHIEIFANGSEAGIATMAAILGEEFSIGVSGVAIWGDETFTSTEDYEGEFTSVGASSGNVRGGFAYASNCFSVSAGGNAIGFQLLPCLNVANTKYIQLFEFNLSDVLNAVTITETCNLA